MIDPNDLLPEELDAQNQPLIRDLRRAYRSERQTAQHLARIHERLTAGHDAHLIRSNLRHTGSGRRENNAHAARIEGRGRGRRWQRHLQMVAAVLVAALVVGSLLLVLNRAQYSHFGMSATPIPPIPARGLPSLAVFHMLDATMGWALGKQGVLRTTDGGQHWNNLTPARVTLQPGSIADFRTATQAWVATPMAVTAGQATTTLVFFTSNGGQSWQQTTIPATVPKQITFVDDLHGWLLAGWRQPGGAAEPVSVFRSSDGGHTWTKVASALFSDATPPGQLPYGGQKTGIHFLNTSTGWVTGTASLAGQAWLYVTHDSGSTWNQQSLPIPAGMSSTQLSILSPTFFSVTDGILPVQFMRPDTESTIATVIYLTHNGGTSWQATSPLPAAASIVNFADAQHGWATDGTVLYTTIDGGNHWQQFSPGTPFQHVSLLDFVSSNVGWAISTPAPTSSVLLKTLDGGHTWTVI